MSNKKLENKQGEQINLSDLLCCPFCGEKNVYLDTHIEDIGEGELDFHRIYCPGCAGWTEWALSKEDTIKQWNQRAT